MNKDIVKGKWLEIKGEVQKAWAKTAGQLGRAARCLPTDSGHHG